MFTAIIEVLTQEEYTVLHCTDQSAQLNHKKGIPGNGNWEILGFLGRRDVILV